MAWGCHMNMVLLLVILEIILLFTTPSGGLVVPCPSGTRPTDRRDGANCPPCNRKPCCC
uniref:Predicted protein n=1 Tax=Hordeum vulgare subsp. vulgare TaxID=112509 RepID=F2DBE2_HORVV|nr:predicted protein [Hordeum vulgare subsp. vulgare]